ncbi:MAG: PEP-CTERM sorting domain-containing protein [Acidobacteriia bacterium]|nr:PEP-CTERM sorting domain-containing protein [Terriglobia bacterium]
MIRNIAKVLVILLATIALMGNATAATILLDTSLSPPGFYNGGGNVNSNFTVSQDGVTELGLSIILRHVGPINPGAGSNVYTIPTGTDSKGISLWGFSFSVNTRYNGGLAVLGEFNYTLNVTDLTTGNIGPTLEPVRLIPDDSGYGLSGKTAGVTPSTEWGAQNSETPSFPGFLSEFDPNAHDLYKITLSQQSLDGLTTLGTVSVFANATGEPVPEPATFGLIGLGLVTLALAVRRQARRS